MGPKSAEFEAATRMRISSIQRKKCATVGITGSVLGGMIEGFELEGQEFPSTIQSRSLWVSETNGSDDPTLLKENKRDEDFGEEGISKSQKRRMRKQKKKEVSLLAKNDSPPTQRKKNKTVKKFFRSLIDNDGILNMEATLQQMNRKQRVRRLASAATHYTRWKRNPFPLAESFVSTISKKLDELMDGGASIDFASLAKDEVRKVVKSEKGVVVKTPSRRQPLSTKFKGHSKDISSKKFEVKTTKVPHIEVLKGCGSFVRSSVKSVEIANVSSSVSQNCKEGLTDDHDDTEANHGSQNIIEREAVNVNIAEINTRKHETSSVESGKCCAVENPIDVSVLNEDHASGPSTPKHSSMPSKAQDTFRTHNELDKMVAIVDLMKNMWHDITDDSKENIWYV
ncbi:hypothetical protein ACOME3_010246 [Neoechinorhynchus agilis]